MKGNSCLCLTKNSRPVRLVAGGMQEDVTATSAYATFSAIISTDEGNRQEEE